MVTKDALIVLITGSAVLLLMALFGVSFIYFFHKHRKKAEEEKQIVYETYQRELLQSQIEIQNHTLQQIAQELHDNIGQLLTVVVMRLNALEDDVEHSSEQQSVQQTRDLVRTVIADIRTLSKTLDPDTVERFGLLPSLTLELERIQRTGRISTALTTDGEAYSLGQQTEIVLLRMAQESINNVLKHANARILTVSVTYKADMFQLMIADDGKGFVVEEASTRTLKQAGSGLNNLLRRSTLLGGTCTIKSEPGEGTCTQILVPRNRII